ncbi:MAG: hypothetical protein ACYCSN_01950 [Acidobacteriaceae bacterium]
MVDTACPFCAHCGAPQLSVPPQELPETSPSGEGDLASAVLSAAGGLPAQHPNDAQWKPIVQVCLWVGAAAGILCGASMVFPPLYTVCFFWTLSGAMIALALYHRRVPLAKIDAGAGARIGLLTGLFMAAAMTAVGSIFLALMRFVWHKGADFDAQISDAIHQGMARAAENNPDPQMVQSSLKFLLTPEGRAGYTLAMVAFLAILLVLFSALSGAVGARLMPSYRKTAA